MTASTASTASTDTTAADAARTATAAPGLRERKRAQTQRSIWSEAIALFLEHGFEAVTVNRIAAAANVSKMTVFNYFPTKEDLVITPMREHIGDAAHAVRTRAAGEGPALALRRDFLARLEDRDASSGLCDITWVVGCQRLLRETPALRLRLYAMHEETRRLLADALAGDGAEPDVLAHARAGQLMGARQALIEENVRRMLAGETADAVHPDAVRAAERVFGHLVGGAAE
ncbi:TetR/AcrR family transcriptional regulator [Streptomyces sp. NBC_01497]|uniref:TetR/AcrR family transcriptional regulator n=1 Tax=Streptomyces sp. NBC_01497 TaxID=2903885 RepID=UPI002E2F82C9|nr:helix-turn-helix domain-containing protein [Streptomyces sp. NBC_01497]